VRKAKKKDLELIKKDATLAITWEVEYEKDGGTKKTFYTLEAQCDLILCRTCGRYYNDPPGCTKCGGMS
jgi:hypothetical protein